VLAVSLLADEESRPHPLWLCILEQALVRTTGPAALDLLFASGAKPDTGPFALGPEAVTVVPAPGPRTLWPVAPGLLRERSRESASSLQSRLACPLQWVLHYAAKLRPSPIARLPEGNQLFGTFGHQVLEETFKEGGDPPTPAAAAKAVEGIFDDRVGLDAAPLATPAETAARHRLRAELSAAAKTLVKALRAGGYRFAGFEKRFEAEVDGIPLCGFIDCLVEKDGGEAVLDFKYSGSWQAGALRDGTAVQLATYAAARRAGEIDSAVAYLVLATARLLTPEGSALAGAEPSQVVSGAPPIRAVWGAFRDALRSTGGWLAGGEPVPAWPLADPGTWPEGVKLLLDEEEDVQSACRWCDYSLLCGLTEVR
jgi:RecB family exonuclease